MAKTKKTPFELHGKEYFVEDLNKEQTVMFQHIGDLERKTNQLLFNLEQLNIGKEAFLLKLQIALTTEEK
tara:strand:+ start:121 stop:330 length:210 start_codon:yes stop_codon:yes gene_type:complete